MNIKFKLIAALLCVATVLTMNSCSKDNIEQEDDKLDIPQTITIKVGEDYNFNINQDWTTSKDFCCDC